MQKQLIPSIIKLVCLVVVTTTTVKAQNNHRFVIRIPFDFEVGGRTLPAGKYTVQRMDPTKPNVLVLKSTKTGLVRMFITQRVEIEDTSTTSSLLFTRYGGEYSPFQVSMMGDNHRHQVSPSHDNDTGGQRGTSTFVRLRVNNKGF